MPKILTIDTSNNKKIEIGLNINGEKSKISSESTVLKSEAVLPLIDKLLKENNVNFMEIKGIKVNIGPGSFTGLRVGVSIANALGYLLKIPVNGKEIGELTAPVYNK